MYVSGFDGFGALGELPRIPIGDAVDIGTRISFEEPTDTLTSPWRRLPGTFVPVQPSIPLGPPPSFDDGGATDDEAEVENGNGAGADAEKESPAADGQPWYQSPWPWIAVAAVLAVTVGYLGLRRRRSPGFGDLREKLRGSKLIVPDLKSGLYYLWRGGNALCAVDGQGQELECFSTVEPTIQAARDLAYRKIRAYHEPGRERWGERDARFAGVR